MRVLIVHNEATYFAGAEKMLGYFLEGVAATDLTVTLAYVTGAKVTAIVPPGVNCLELTNNQRFSPKDFSKQVRELVGLCGKEKFDVIHGWAARDWELAALVGKLARVPVALTLHDHPQAGFISAKRQLLMRWCSKWGAQKTVCVSKAVREVCVTAGYANEKLAVIHNGLPLARSNEKAVRNDPCRIGFLGLFSERKGFPGVFQIMDELARRSSVPWELHLAGDAQSEDGQRRVADLKRQYDRTSWWPRVKWLGWVDKPLEFLSSLDLLLCPSADFDPFPTVLLEAGAVGLPVLAAKVGGVAEIVEDGKTGWLFKAGDWQEAGARLAGLLSEPGGLQTVGLAARERIQSEFTLKKMVVEYHGLYSTITGR